MVGRVIVVSGLPRSGTSLVMQMLQAGGITLLVDDHRPCDRNNPRGYMEYSPVKTIAADSTWMHLAIGKAVKIVAPLIPFLPNTHAYDILFVRRDIREILASQAVMLGKSQEEAQSNVELSSAMQGFIKSAMAFCERQPKIQLQILEHRKLLQQPLVAAQIIESLVGIGLDKEAMALAVETQLYRNRV